MFLHAPSLPRRFSPCKSLMAPRMSSAKAGCSRRCTRTAIPIVDRDPDFVVVGEGRTFNLEMVEAAVSMVHRGAKLVATNLDPNCPTAERHSPRLRRLCRYAGGRHRRKGLQRGQAQPSHDADRAERNVQLSTDETIMIGDTMETDILGGVQMGFHTVLVLSGGTKHEDLPRYQYRPEIVVDSLAEYSEILVRNGGVPPWLEKPQKSTLRTE